MVNVTLDNFLEQSSDLLQYLKSAVLVSMDEEMTGITMPQNTMHRPPKDDDPATRYSTYLKPVPEHYNIMQIGLCLFTSEHELRQYNFHLFPSSTTTTATPSAVDVTMNASSIHFLNRHGMDFNQWIKQGIPYCTHEAAKHKIRHCYKKLLLESQPSTTTPYSNNKRNGDRITLKRQDDIHFRARAMATLREWLDNPTQPSRVNNNDHNGDNSFRERLSLLLPACSAFLRRALYEAIQEEYPSLVLEKDEESSDRIRVWRLTPQERLERQERQKQALWEGLLKDLGFWRLFCALTHHRTQHTLLDPNCTYEVLLQHKSMESLELWLDELILSKTTTTTTTTTTTSRPIPLVVHNGLQDLLFLLTHCHSPTLPDSYQDTKELLHNTFPCVYDTKILATESLVRVEQSVLSQLFKKLVVEGHDPTTNNNNPNANESNNANNNNENDQPPRPPFVVTNEDGSQEERPHEAAYDAFMTGAVFVRICQRIRQHELRQRSQNQEVHESAPSYPWQPNATDEDMRDLYCRNKLYLMLTLYTIDLEKKEDPLNRGMDPQSTFRVSDFEASSVSSQDIVRCLTLSAATVRLQFEIIWINSTTFLVATQDRSKQVVSTALQRHFGGRSRISTLQQHMEQQKQLQLQQLQQQPSSAVTTAKRGIWSSIMGLFGGRVLPNEPGRKRRRIE